MNFFSTGRLLLALASMLWLGTPSRAAALSARVDLDGCVDLDRDEVRRLIGIELQTSEPLDGAPLLHVSCVDGEAELRVRPLAGPAVVRTLDLASIPSSARVRLLALAATELLAAAADPDPPPRPRARKNLKPRSESTMFKRVLAGGLALFAAALPASAARPAPRAPAAQPTALTHPAPRPRDDPHAPALRAEDVFTAVGEKVHEITDAQIQIMERLIQATADSDAQKPELIFQWADLFAEQQRYHRFRARSLDQVIFDARRAGQAARAAQAAAQQAEEERRERSALLQAVKRYLSVADDPRFARYARMDEVLFEIGHLLTQAKKDEAARGYFRRLIKDHPTSRFIPDAYLAFAEYFFETKNMENAIAFYEKVMEHEESPLAGYALYKKGWCHYNLGEFKQALGTFVAVIDRARRAPTPAAGRWALEREARKDAVRAYAQVGGPERAWAFFQKVGGEAAPAMLEQLAELYNSQGKFADAARLYRQLMALAPASPRLCVWQSEVVKNTLAQNGARAEPETVKELERLTAVYQKLRDKSGAPPAALAECREGASQTLRELAAVWHKEGQTTGQQTTLEAAAALYRAYLSQFRNDKDAYTVSYYYGELLYRLAQFDGQRARYCEAAPVYSDVVKMDSSPRAKYLNDAALAAVYAWKECLRLDDNPPAIARADASDRRHAHPQPRPIPDAWHKLIDSFDIYFKYVSNGPEFTRLEYRKARVYYEFDHLKEAIPLFRDIAYRHTETEYAVYAADLLFDCYAQLEEKTELRASRDELCEKPALKTVNEDFSRRCRTIHAAILRDDAETLEAARDYKAAGDLYIQLASEFPDDPKLDEILYDAAINYQRSKMIGLAVLAFQQLMRAKPDSPLAKKSVYMIGRNYQDIAAYEAAAENYETFATRWPGERDASAALYSASFFRRGLGENQKAIDDARLFIQNYGPRAEFTDIAAGVAFGEGQIFEQQRDWPRLEQHLKNYLRDWGARGGVDRALVAHVKLGEIAWRAACPVEGANGACVEIKRPTHHRAPASRRPGATCGAGLQVTLHERKPAGVREAQAHFAAALKLFQNGAAAQKVGGKDEAERDARARELVYYAAQARMLQGDAEYEKFLAMPLPDGLAFAPGAKGHASKRDAESRRRLAAWLQSKSRQLEQARRHYENVISFKQAHWAIAAAARIGQLFQVFAAQISTAPVPVAPPPPPGVAAQEWRDNFRDAFCDELGNHVAVLEDKAEDALKMCLDKSTQLSWFNEWSSLCEAELNQLKPTTYPLASELRAEPGFLAAGTDRAPPRGLER